MSIKLDRNKTGLTLGLVLGGWHLIWSLLVAFGWAQAVIDFIFKLHFIRPVYIVTPFSFDLAAALVAITAAVGYLSGYAFAAIWNWIQRR